MQRRSAEGRSEVAVVSLRRQIWVATHRGHARPTNQDRALALSRRTNDGNESWSVSAGDTCLWAAVADGMGGHEAGNIASDVAIDAACQLLPEARSEREMFELAEVANRMTFQAMFSGEGRMRMGSTLVATSVRSNIGLLVNVGDSRAYLLSGRQLRLLSKDDTLPNAREGRRQHMLTQSLGGLAFQAPITPHVARFHLDVADQILLCSDGLTDMVDDEEIADILLSRPDEPAISLINSALQGGGRDNITAIVIGRRY